MHLLAATQLADTSILHAETIDDALQSLREHSVSLAFLDNRLPPFTRFEEPLARFREISEVPVILLTGTDLDELGYEDLPDGLDGFLSKNDLSPLTLLQAIQQVLGPSAED